MRHKYKIENYNKNWEACKSFLQKQMPDSLFTNMIEPLKIRDQVSLGFNKDTLEIIAPKKEIANRVNERYLHLIQEYYESSSEKYKAINISTDLKKETAKLNLKKNLPKDQILSSILLESNFYIPEVNSWYIERLWEDTKILHFMYGGSGSGKTSLANTLVKYKEALGKKVLLLTAEAFLGSLASAASNRNSVKWRKKLQSYDCLIIDDFQYMKPNGFRSQEELIYLIDNFLTNEKILLFCADRVPHKLKLIPNLLSRLQAGRLITLEYPNIEERKKILKDEFSLYRKRIEPKNLEYLAEVISKDMRNLKSAVLRIHELSLRSKILPMGLKKEDLDRLCEDLYSFKKKSNGKDVLLLVGDYYKISPDEIISSSRKKKHSLARHLVAYLCHTYLKFNLQKTAKLIARKDHTSVIHACKKIEKLMEQDLFFRQQVAKLIGDI